MQRVSDAFENGKIAFKGNPLFSLTSGCRGARRSQDHDVVRGGTVTYYTSGGHN
jgi:hypothetical protein